MLKYYAEPLLRRISPSSPAYTEATRLLKFLDYIVALSPDEIAAIPGIYVDSLARVGDEVHKYMPLGDILFDTDTIDETFDIIRRVNDTVSIKNTDGEDILIRYTDFDYLRNVYQEGLEGR